MPLNTNIIFDNCYPIRDTKEICIISLSLSLRLHAFVIGKNKFDILTPSIGY